jgi:hypothetical protein
MTTLTQGKVALQFLLNEADRGYSRDNIVIKSGSGKLSAGMVLGKITTGGKFIPNDPAAVDGSQTAVAVLAYNVDATSADVATVGIMRHAEVKTSELSYSAAIGSDTTKQGTAQGQLKAAGIVPR